MKLTAIHRLEGKKVIDPGTVFDADKESAERLIALGAAVAVEDVQDEKPAITAAEVIAKIQDCKTAEDLDNLIAGDTRKTVLDAADKARKAFEVKG